MSRGFTILELLMVATIILALAGLSYPVINRVRVNAQIHATKMLVTSVSTAVESYQLRLVSGIDGVGYRAWTLGWDGTSGSPLDGDPTLYPVGHVITQRAPPSYRGFVYMTGIDVGSRSRLDAFNRITDVWHQPLQLSYASNTYGVSGFGIWSMGPDRVSGTADDITSWTNNE